MPESTNADGVRLGAVDKALEVIELLEELDGATIAELTDELEWPKSTVYSYVRTLEENEYIVNENGSYYLGFQFLNLGGYVQNRKEVYSIIEPKVTKLAEKTEERVQFVIEEYGNAVYVQITEGDGAVSTGGRTGQRRPMLHATAAGKSILAHIPDGRVQNIIDKRGLPEFTVNTITDEDVLYEELLEIRDREFAINNEERITGMRAVGAPINHPVDGTIGAISIAGPAHRIQGDVVSTLSDQVMATQNEIELDIQYG